MASSKFDMNLTKRKPTWGQSKMNMRNSNRKGTKEIQEEIGDQTTCKNSTKIMDKI